MINFRYHIREKLGHGGSGEVFLAEDTLRKNLLCALKVLHASGIAGGESEEAFLNEVSALLNLSHPNLVRIYDFGLVRHADEQALQHRRFFTMELIRGADALEWTSSISNLKEKDAFLKMLLLQTLSVLSYIHREGIIHYDIKPQNLILVGEKGVTAIPVVKLTDFGFAKKDESKERIDVRGTLEYTAPELLRGDPHDYRVDLYSLGATMFHLIEGHCPFEATSPVELAKRVLTEEPVFSSGTSRAGEQMREVVAGLLQKDPAKRFRNAEAAASKLVGDTAVGKELFESYFGLSKKSRFIGRKDEIQILQHAIESLVQSQSATQSAFIVSGVEGIGKTALVGEAVKRGRSHDIPVLDTEVIESGIPFGAIAPVLALLSSEARSFSETGRIVVAKYTDILKLDKRDDVATFQMWGQEEEKFIELQSRFLLECAGIFPFVLVADNIQLLDAQSIGVLRTTIRDNVSGRLLFIGAETAEKATVIASPVADEINLRELTAEEIAEMSSSVLGSTSLTQDISALIYQLYGGTPGIVLEALNAVSDVVANVQADGSSIVLANLEARLPKNIDDVLLSRFRKLGRERQLILSMLSCFQNPVSADVLVKLLPFHRQRTLDQLRFLHLDGFIGFSENEQLSFVRLRRLKNAVYESLKEEQLDLHRLIASTLDDSDRKLSFVELQEVAYQYSECNDAGKSFLYFEAAADEGLRLFALQRALQLYCAAIAAAVEERNPVHEEVIRVKYHSALYRAGAYQEAVVLGKQLIQRQDLMPENKMSVVKILGLALSRLGETDQAQGHIALALQSSTDDVERIELEQELVGLKISSGRFKEAETKCCEQLDQAKKLNNDKLAGAIYTDLGIATFFQDRFDYSAECFSEALKRFEELQEKTQVINAMNNIGNALSAKGDFPRAIANWEIALKASREYGTLLQQAQIQNNLGIASYNLKTFQRAKVFYDEARLNYERINSRFGLADVLTNLGEVMFAEGEYEPALTRWSEAKKLYASLDNAHALVETCLHIAAVLARLGDLEEMKRELDEAKQVIQERKLETFQAEENYLSGVAFLLRGEFGSAEACLRNAQDQYRSDKAKEMFWRCSLKLAECSQLQGRYGEAVLIAEEVLLHPNAKMIPQIVAEAAHLLGIIAIANPKAVKEKAIFYFKQGLEMIAKEPVSEITWKLAFALAREYYERGQSERAKEFLTKTKLVLQFFLSHITTAKLRDFYLLIDQKNKVLATIDAIAKS